MASYELVDNGLRYGSVANEVTFELLQDEDGVEVCVSNHAVPARIAMLREQVGKLRTDAAGTYLDEMRRSQGGGIHRSMLGLARVTHEAKMELSVLEAEGGRVVVSARCKR